MTCEQYACVSYLSLQLADCIGEIQHQFGDILQLVLQELDGIGLPLVLRSHRTTVTESSVNTVKYSQISNVHRSIYLAVSELMQTDLLFSNAGGVLQFDDGFIERSLHLFHLFTVPEQDNISL